MTILTLAVDGKLTADTFPSDFLRYAYNQIECGLVDRVRLTDKIDMWVDDEGMFTQEINPYATKLANNFGYPVEWLFGNAVITGTRWTDEGPEAGPLSSQQMSDIKSKMTWL